MAKNLLFSLFLLLSSLFSFHGISQSQLHLSSSGLPKPTPSFLAPSEYKPSWQRLLLQLSFTFFNVAKENQIGLDSSLLYASHSLGLSRLSVITENFDDEGLLKESSWMNERNPGEGFRRLPGLRGINHLKLLVLLGAYYAFQPDSYHKYQDSVIFFLSKARNESKALHELKWRRQAMCLLGKLYVEGNALKQGAAIFKQLIDECHADGDIENEAKGWAYRGLYSAYSPGTTKDRIFYLEKAMNLYKRRNNVEGEINVLTDIGYLWVSNFHLKKAYDVFLQALNLENSIGFPYTHYNTEAVAMVTKFQGKYGEPLKYAFQSVNTSEAARDSIGWAFFYSRLGALYDYEGTRSAESLKWTQKAMDRFMLTGGDHSLYPNLDNIVSFLVDKGRPAQALSEVYRVAKLYPPLDIINRMYYYAMLGHCYLGLKQYALSEKNYLKAAKLEKQSEPMRGNFRRAFPIVQLGFLYFKSGQYAKAKVYFQRFLSDPSHVGIPLLTYANVLRQLSVIDSASGNYISALRFFQQYHNVIDSNFRISKIRQAEELEVQYEIKKKENEIKIKDMDIRMLNQNARLQQANLSKSSFIENVTVGGLVLLMIMIILLYRQYWQKQKANQLITQKNDVITQKNKMLEHLITEKEWLLKEVHHRTKNNLHTVICLLESQAAYLEKDALKAIESSQHRIYAMLLIHQKLYQSEDIKTIDMAVYLPEFIQYLNDSFGNTSFIRFQLDIESIKIGVSQAIPLGLIINEAVTNSIKHAFPGKKAAIIQIQLHQTGKQVKLVVADNGIGMHPIIKDKENETNSLGIELMKGLSKDINGKIYFETEKGTKIIVIFGVDPLNEGNNLLITSTERAVYL